MLDTRVWPSTSCLSVPAEALLPAQLLPLAAVLLLLATPVLLLLLLQPRSRAASPSSPKLAQPEASKLVRAARGAEARQEPESRVPATLRCSSEVSELSAEAAPSSVRSTQRARDRERSCLHWPTRGMAESSMERMSTCGGGVIRALMKV